MKLFDFTVQISAKPAEVFQIIADPRNLLLWVPLIHRVELLSQPPIRVGTKYIASSAIGPFEFVFHEQILELEEGKKKVYEGRSKWGYFTSRVTLEPQEEGTVVHQRMDYFFPAGAIGILFGYVVRPIIRWIMQPLSAKRMKKAIEERLGKHPVT